MKILSTLRSGYLYLALTIATIAIAIAAVMLIGLGLELAGLADAPPTSDDVRERVSLAGAILIFSVPVYAVHLWLVLRTLRDPEERVDDSRHFFLNVWIAAGLTTAAISSFVIADTTIVQRSLDLGMPIAALCLGAASAFGAWRWRDATPGGARVWQVIGAYAALLIASILGVASVYQVMGALGMSYPSWAELGLALPREVWSGLVDIVLALAMWTIAYRWQWAWRDLTFRTIYASAGLGIGLAYLFLPGVDELGRVIATLRGSLTMIDVARFWADPMVGAFLVAQHLSWLLADRSRIALPARVTDRLVRGIAALVGLVGLFIAWGAAWMYVAQDVLRLGPPPRPPLFVPEFAPKPIGNDNEALAAAILGIALFAPAWWGFLRSTAGDVRSSLRRAYVLVVVTLSLAATIVAGAISAYNAISLLLGAQDTDPLIRTAIDAAGVAVGAAVILAAHLWLLLRDMRAARLATAPVATVRPVVDPLVAMLQEVAAGRITPDAAATKIRAGLVPERGAPRGRTA